MIPSNPKSSSAPSAGKAGVVTLTGQILKTIIQIIGLVVFSHILNPEEIGIFTMVMVFLFLGELIRDFGISQAALQQEHLSDGQATNLFWTNLAIGSSLTIGLYFASPAIAQFFNEPALNEITPWIGLSFTLNALESQFQVQLARADKFLVLSLTDISSQLLGLLIGIFAALSGLSYWSLVIQMLAYYFARLVQRLLLASWSPGLPRRQSGMVALYRFGLHAGLAQLINFVASNIDTLIIGSRWGAEKLGVYNRGFQLFSAPAQQVFSPLTNVALPLLAREHRESGNFYPLLWKAQVVLCSGLTYVLMIMAATSVPLTGMLLGSAWTDTSTILTILSIGGVAQGLSFINYWTFLASGNSKQLLLQSFVTKSILTIFVLIGAFGDIRGVATGFSAALVITWLITLKWLNKCADLPFSRFLQSGLHIFISGLFGGSVGYWIVHKLSATSSELFIFAAGATFATVIYIPLIMLNPSIRKLLTTFIQPNIK
jgi:PST family polysaccharide transporter